MNIYGAIAAANAKGSILSYVKGGDTHRIPNASNIVISGGDADEVEVEALAEDDASFTGRPGVESISVDFNAFPLAHQSFIDLLESRGDGLPLEFTIQTAPAIITPPGTAMAQITNTGEVTLSGAGIPRLGNVVKVGHVLVIGAALYKVDRFVRTGTVTKMHVRPAPSAAVTAATFKFGVPKVTFDFAATVRQVGNLVFATNAAISGTLLITPTSPMPAPVLSAS